MASDEEALEARYQKVRRDDNESTIQDLADSQPFDTSPHSREALLDRADINYGLLFEAGKIDGPFEYPTVRANRLHNEARETNRPRVFRNNYWGHNQGTPEEMIEAADPISVLSEFAENTYVIREEISDNDVVANSFHVMWMLPEDQADAERYCSQAGYYHYVSGGGEYEGRSTSLDIFYCDPSGQVMQKTSEHGSYRPYEKN